MKIIILLGEEPINKQYQRLETSIQDAISKTNNKRIAQGGNPDQLEYQLLGDGKKTIKALLQDENIQNILKSADENCLVFISAHGMYLEENKERVGHFIEETDTIDLLNLLPDNIKNIQFDSCHIGSLFRLDVKDQKEAKEIKQEPENKKEKAIANRLIFANGNSKNETIRGLSQIITSIENSFSLTPKQSIIEDILYSPLSKYLSYDDPSQPNLPPKICKFPRLFRGIKLEDVQPESINKVMDDFIIKRAQMLSEIFPEEQKFISKFLQENIRKELAQKLINEATYLFSFNGNLEVMQMLAKSGADLNAPNYKDYTPLFYASYHNKNHPEIVELLLNQKDKNGKKIIDPTIPDKYGFTILDRADENNYKDTIKILLEDHRVYPSLVKREYDLLLSDACKAGHKNVAQFIYDNDNEINLNFQSPDFQITALMEACLNNRPNIVEWLLKFDELDPNLQSMNGDTALMFSCVGNNEELVKIILNSGKEIDLLATNISGESVLDIAHQNKNIMALLVKRLEEQLMIACKNKDLEMAAAILSNPEIAPNISDKYGITPLMYASSNRDLEMISLLLSKAANPDIEAERGETAIQFSIIRGHINGVNELLKAGAKLPEEDKIKNLINLIKDPSAKNRIEEILEKHLEKLDFAEKEEKAIILPPSPKLSHANSEILKDPESLSK